MPGKKYYISLLSPSFGTYTVLRATERVDESIRQRMSVDSSVEEKSFPFFPEKIFEKSLRKKMAQT